MDESKYGKYIVTEMKKNLILPWGVPGVLDEYEPGKNRPMEHVLWLDGEQAPGCFYSECVWFFSPDKVNPEKLEKMRKAGGGGPRPHTHPFDELFTFWGTNFDNPHDLGAEVEFWLEDQKFIFSKSCFLYIPAGMKHCPIQFTRMDRSFFHFSFAPAQKYDFTEISGGGEYAGKGDIGKYFVFQDKPNLKLPEYRHEIPKDVAQCVAYLDGEVVPGANFYAEAGWFWPGKKHPLQTGKEPLAKAHTHPFSEMIGFFGTNENDIHDLCGEAELWINGEQHIMNKSFVAFIPAGMEHCPLTIRRIDKPIFHFTVGGPTKVYG